MLDLNSSGILKSIGFRLRRCQQRFPVIGRISLGSIEVKVARR